MHNGHASADPLPVRNDLPDDQQQLFAALVHQPQIPIGIWPHAAVISANNFVFKSLSSWSFNIAVGCCHGCAFCYVPSVATLKQARRLSAYGVTDPDQEWGRYVLLRSWDETKFLASVRRRIICESFSAIYEWRGISLCSTIVCCRGLRPKTTVC
jgi:hypothetical protein